jgi:hypothetical protein
VEDHASTSSHCPQSIALAPDTRAAAVSIWRASKSWPVTLIEATSHLGRAQSRLNAALTGDVMSKERIRELELLRDAWSTHVHRIRTEMVLQEQGHLARKSRR